MSIENNLKRIADALEIIAASGGALITAPAPAPASPPAAGPAPAPAPTLLSDEDMNAALVIEFKRLGSREQIDIEMVRLSITGVAGLTAEVQTTLLTAIRAIPNG